MNLNSKIGLGSVQFGIFYGISNTQGQTSSEEVERLIGLALANGIDLIDTASAYGNAEEILGSKNMKDFRVVSKFMPPGRNEDLQVQLQESLRKLRLSCIYAYLAHRPLDLYKNPQQWEELVGFKNSGLVKKIGFSLNEPRELKLLMDRGFFPDLIQVPFNYFDRRFEKSVVALKEKGCEIHTRTTFLQGLFFANPDNLDSFFEAVKPLIKSFQSSVKNLPGALLKFVVEKPFVDKVIVGVENCKQLHENIGSLSCAEQLPKLPFNLPETVVMPSKWPKKA